MQVTAKRPGHSLPSASDGGSKLSCGPWGGFWSGSSRDTVLARSPPIWPAGALCGASLADIALKFGPLHFEARYPGDLTQPIDPRAITYRVDFKEPVGEEQSAERVERPDPTEPLP